MNKTMNPSLFLGSIHAIDLFYVYLEIKTGFTDNESYVIKKDSLLQLKHRIKKRNDEAINLYNRKQVRVITNTLENLDSMNHYTEIDLMKKKIRCEYNRLNNELTTIVEEIFNLIDERIKLIEKAYNEFK